MGIISKIKSVLGVAGDGQERSRERRRAASVDDEPETSSERAVKGVDRPSDGRPAEAESEPPLDEPGSTTTVSGGADRQGVTDSAAGGAAAEPVDSIKGIGSAYAKRLADAGIDSVADLARADPEELAAATDLGTGRVGKWIERARARTE